MSSLSSLPCTSYYISKMPADHDLLKAVLDVAYGKGYGEARSRKAELGEFAGFAAGRDPAKVAAAMKADAAWKKPCLVDLCAFFDLESSGDRSSLIQRAVDFMAKPHATKRTKCNEDGVPLHLVKNSRRSDSSSSSKKRSRPSSSSSSSRAKKAKSAPPPAKSPKKPTKPKSAKFLYIQDRKDAAKAANPGMDSTALAMKLIAEYKALSEEEKQKYKDRAAAEKKAFEEAQALLAEMEEMGDMLL